MRRVEAGGEPGRPLIGNRRDVFGFGGLVG